MKLTSLGITIGRTINMGAYNSLKIECHAAAELDVLDDPAEVRTKLVDQCRAGLKAAWETRKDELL